MSDLFRKVTPGRNAGARPVPASASASGVPVAGLSIFDPIFLGIDENGEGVYLELVYRNLLGGGEPGGGKSGLLNTIVAHAALCTDTRLVLFDGKEVELGMWREVADEFVGPDITHALVLRRLQTVMNNRYAWLRHHGRRKLAPSDGLSVIPRSSTRSRSSPPPSVRSRSRKNSSLSCATS